MLFDARSVTDGQVLDTDLCIVGAGPAGITLATRLASHGLRVLLLESGDARWSVRGKDLTRGENVDPNYYRLEWTRLRTFGGSSWAWRTHGLRTRPFGALDLADRPEIQRRGWPFAAGELSAYWDHARDLCGLPPVGFGTEDWESLSAPALRGDPDLDTVMFPVGPGDAFLRRLDEVGAMQQVTCLLNATVLELETDGSGKRVDRAWVTSGDGRSFHVRARTFTLAMGGIENARLLLLSRRGRRHGIGNGHDLVGRAFMEHPHVRTGILRPFAGSGAAASRLYQRVERGGGAAIGFLRPSDEALQREGLLGSAWALHPSTPALSSEVGRSLTDLKDTMRSYVRPTPGSAERLALLGRHPVRVASTMITSRSVRRGQRSAPEFRLLVMAEQAPNPASRVVLGARRDRYGQPVARLDWRLTEQDLRSIRRTQDVLSAALERAGIGRIVARFGDVEPPPLLGGGYHHMGTTRMDDDPRAGVVDRHGRVHGVANLYVAGSSVFPTGGVANPTLTIVALTLRLADHLRRSSEA